MNDASQSMPEVATRAGTARPRGKRRRGVPRRSVRRAPVGELRFEPPRDHAAWSGVRDALADGPIARKAVRGWRTSWGLRTAAKRGLPDAEPMDAARPRRGRGPSWWLHGGAYSSGAGSLPWYAGDRFAANGDGCSCR